MAEHGFRVVFLVGCLLFAGMGCERRSVEAQAVDKNPAKQGQVMTNRVGSVLKDLRPDDCMVQVDDRCLTKWRFEELYGEEIALNKHLEKSLTKEQWEQFCRKTAYNTVNVFVVRETMLQEARRQKIEPQAEDLKSAERFIDEICARLKLGREKYAERFKRGMEEVNTRIREEAVLKALLRKQFVGKLEASLDEAKTLHDELVKENRAASETNSIRLTAMRNIHDQAVAGILTVPDGEITKANFHLPPGGIVERLPDLDIDKLEESDLKAALLKLKPGQWTSVLDLEESFDLYRLETQHRVEGATKYGFLRISVEKDLGYDVPEVDKLRADIAERKRNALQVPWIKEIASKIALCYPNGVTWFDQAEAK